MTPEQIAFGTLMVQIVASGVISLFMWGLNSRFKSVQTEITGKVNALDQKVSVQVKNLEDRTSRQSGHIEKLFDEKVDKETCKDNRDNCPAKQRVA